MNATQQIGERRRWASFRVTAAIVAAAVVPLVGGVLAAPAAASNADDCGAVIRMCISSPFAPEQDPGPGANSQPRSYHSHRHPLSAHARAGHKHHRRGR